MTPRQIALLKEAVRHDGFVDYDGYDDAIDELLDDGLLVDIGLCTLQITAEGREALRDAREW